MRKIKKIIITILVLTIALSTVVVCNATSSYEIGDVDLSGEVAISDATKILKFLVEIENFTDVQMELADTNFDNVINVMDATLIQKWIAEIKEKATRPTTEPTTVPITEPTTEPITEPITEPTVQPTTSDGEWLPGYFD